MRASLIMKAGATKGRELLRREQLKSFILQKLYADLGAKNSDFFVSKQEIKCTLRDYLLHFCFLRKSV